MDKRVKRVIILMCCGWLTQSLYSIDMKERDWRVSQLDQLQNDLQAISQENLNEWRESLICKSKALCEGAYRKALKNKQVRETALSNNFGITRAPLSLDFSFPVALGHDDVTISIFSNEAYVIVGDGQLIKPYCQRIDLGEGVRADDLKAMLRMYEYVYPAESDDFCLHVGCLASGKHGTKDVRLFTFQVNRMDEASLNQDVYWGDPMSVSTYRIMARIVRQLLGRLHRHRLKSCPRTI